MTVVGGITYAPGHEPKVPSYAPGTVLTDARGVAWEFVRVGCATDSRNCKHAPGSTTVYQLDKRGRRRWGMTECVNGYELEPAPPS